MNDTLNLDDTHELIEIFEGLADEVYDRKERVRITVELLGDFIARRGFDENPLKLTDKQLQIELEHKEACVECQTSYSWQLCPTIRKELTKEACVECQTSYSWQLCPTLRKELGK